MDDAAPPARASAALAATAACLALAGCGGLAAASPPPLIPPTPAACPAKPLPSLPAQSWPAVQSALAPAGASEIRLCRYSGVNAHPRLALVRSRLLVGAAGVGALVRAFDQLPTGPPGLINCPSDDGSQIVARLAYPAGQRVTITVALTGCTQVTNGSVARTAVGTSLIGQLERFLAPQKRTRHKHRHARPTAARWSVLARSPIGAPPSARLAWDGRELLELFGRSGASTSGTAAYDPALRRWRRLSKTPAAVQPANAASVWTGRQVFVFGGTPALYDPASNRWTVASAAPFGALNDATAVWTGSRVVLAGLTPGTSPQLEVAAFDPAANSWTSLAPPIASDHPPEGLAVVATGDGVLLWSLWSRSEQSGPGAFAIHSGIDVLRLSPSGAWTDVTGSWPQSHTVDQPTFTGTEILFAPGQIWCGLCPHPAPFGEHGYTADPVTLDRTDIPAGPFDDLGPQIIWTGAAEISLNAGGEMSGPGVRVLPGDIAVWSPRTGRWSRGPRAPKQLAAAPAVWAAGRLYALANDGTLLAYRAP